MSSSNLVYHLLQSTTTDDIIEEKLIRKKPVPVQLFSVIDDCTEMLWSFAKPKDQPNESLRFMKNINNDVQQMKNGLPVFNSWESYDDAIDLESYSFFIIEKEKYVIVVEGSKEDLEYEVITFFLKSKNVENFLMAWSDKPKSYKQDRFEQWISFDYNEVFKVYKP